jgi:glycosyltransferase involved in cell wall biosynthesis
MIGKFIDAMPSRFRQIREASAGKCRAQNRAIAQAKGTILGFFDDDVQLTPE